MTVTEMQVRLHSRGLTMQAFESNDGGPAWVVWLYSRTDPGLGVITGEGNYMEDAFDDALKQWDGLVEDEEGEIVEETSPSGGQQFTLTPVR